jgi:hypothetical protein
MHTDNGHARKGFVTGARALFAEQHRPSPQQPGLALALPGFVTAQVRTPRRVPLQRARRSLRRDEQPATAVAAAP